MRLHIGHSSNLASECHNSASNHGGSWLAGYSPNNVECTLSIQETIADIDQLYNWQLIELARLTRFAYKSQNVCRYLLNGLRTFSTVRPDCLRTPDSGVGDGVLLDRWCSPFNCCTIRTRIQSLGLIYKSIIMERQELLFVVENSDACSFFCNI